MRPAIVKKLVLTSFPSFDNFHNRQSFYKEVVIVSNIFGIIIGAVVVILGAILLIFCWWSSFVVVFKGTLPILLIFVGGGVLIYFVSEIKSKAGMGKGEVSAPEEKKPE
jgi:hypothetical protein